MALTDEQLREEMRLGRGPSDVARKHGNTRQYWSARMTKLKAGANAVAVVAPQESRQYVAAQVHALTELGESLAACKLLLAACDEWLRDAKDPSKYDLGARSHEVLVTYWDVVGEKDVKDKATLQSLLTRVEKRYLVDKAEIKFADPRELVLKTAQEVRQTVQAGVQMAALLADARSMETFKEALLAEISKVSPDVAQSIAQAVQRRIILYHDPDGDRAVPAGSGPADSRV